MKTLRADERMNAQLRRSLDPSSATVERIVAGALASRPGRSRWPLIVGALLALAGTWWAVGSSPWGGPSGDAAYVGNKGEVLVSGSARAGWRIHNGSRPEGTGEPIIQIISLGDAR